MKKSKAFKCEKKDCFYNDAEKCRLKEQRSRFTKISPCDVCKFYPPSSGDGKPCSICPAAAID